MLVCLDVYSVAVFVKGKILLKRENKILKESKWEGQSMTLALNDRGILLTMFSLLYKTKLKDSIAAGVCSVKESMQPCYSA